MSRRMLSAVALVLAAGAFTVRGQDRAPRFFNAPGVIVEAEPNNSRAEATPLPAGALPVAVGQGALSYVGDEDYWTFVACGNCTVNAWVDTGGPTFGNSRDTILDLYTGNGFLLETDDDDGVGTGGDFTVETEFSSLITRKTGNAGRYHLRVRGFSPSHIVNPYRLYVAVSGWNSIETEPNGTAGTADNISLGVNYQSTLSSSADVDYFQVPGSGAYTMLCAFVNGDPEEDDTSTHVTLEIRDNADALLLTVNGAPASAGRRSEGLCFPATAGTQYLRVASDAGSSGTYSIIVFPGRGASLSRIDFSRRFVQDIAVWRPVSGTWHSLFGGGGWNPAFAETVQWGASGDIPVAADYDGDGRTDRAVFRPSTGAWYVRQSTALFQPMTFVWGQNGDVPQPRDFDGDGLADPAVFRPSTGQWFVLKSRTSYATSMTTVWGMSGDVPVAADHDGDGLADFAVWRPSTGNWHRLASGRGHAPVPVVQFGTAGDIPVLFLSGLGLAAPHVFRPASGTWYGTGQVQFGQNGDIPVPGHYDDDTLTDRAVWRPSTGAWYVSRTSASPFVLTWGVGSDIPIKDSY